MRKQFTTTINESIQKDFRMACVKNDFKMNVVLEVLMEMYSNGEIKIEKSK